MTKKKQKNLAYALGQPYVSIAAEPIVSTRDPKTTDSSELGTIWVNSRTANAYVLSQVRNNTATWQEFGQGGAATFTNLTADSLETTGDITSTGADVTAENGAVNVNGVSVISNTGDPNGTVAAAQGSLFLRQDGSGTNDRLYVNQDGAQAWVNVTTSA